MIVVWQAGAGAAGGDPPARRASAHAGRGRDALAEAQAASKHAEEAFDAASDRFDTAGSVLEGAGEHRAQARRDRYAVQQAYERAALTVDRLQRRVADLSGRLD